MSKQALSGLSLSRHDTAILKEWELKVYLDAIVTAQPKGGRGFSGSPYTWEDAIIDALDTGKEPLTRSQWNVVSAYAELWGRSYARAAQGKGTHKNPTRLPVF